MFCEWRHPSSVTIHRKVMDGFSAIQLALREWSRRFLRHSLLTINCQEHFIDKISQLNIEFNEKVPKQYSIINFNTINEKMIFMYDNDQLIGQIGGEQPLDVSTLYIPSNDINEYWKMIEVILADLITAGYPGCIGCGGNDANEVWDEMASRHKLSNQDL